MPTKTSSSRNEIISLKLSTFVSMLRCVSIAPFGTPVEPEVITEPEQAEAVDVLSVARFAASPLYARLRDASRVERELPFTRRVPAAANWPGTIEPERVVGSPVSKLDWAPTLIRLAGGQVNPAWKLEGADIWPLLTGEAGPAQSRQFFWNHGNAVRALRDGDWKLILHRNGRVELFNLAIDPNEEHDLSEEDVQKVEQLRAELDRWQRETQPSD